MLTFLFALAAIWTLFWLVMYMLDWSDSTSFTDSKVLCATCAASTSGGKAGSAKGSSANFAGAKPVAGNNAKSAAQKAKDADADANVKAARADARKQAAEQANEKARNNAVKKPVADKHDQANVKPLFVAPKEKDDLKVIKGIGVVMEKTLNDLGITTFKQLAGFKQTDVKMVSDALDASNSGFGDRIERDEWVDQAKVLAKKAG